MESQVKPSEENEKLARLFAALGNPLRLNILKIVSSSDRPLHIKGIARIIKTRYPITYKHVKTLQEAGLVTIYEVGRSRVVSPKTSDLYRKITGFGEEILS
ncbi:MAG: winged helix-turn-helix domain-containing protein [Candidatus Caldarchaeum sp.]|nr:winged helix-turn-helix domain-containing protein [Candidatus Caldarchaeum sp.]MCX8200781.1 winged helix-turn-helix domain-containing protein [Candidatus Caldarchaeum sp.]MDW8435370.1 winged helix-turn-helix domain-containing protein [Candidatus Caldarchaeum sp.]